MATQGISGTAVAALAAGGILAWSGVKGYSVSTTVKDFLSGKDPRTQQPTETVSPGGLITGLFGGLIPGIGSGSGGSGANFKVTGGDTSAHSTTASQNQAIAKRLLPQFGLNPAEFPDLVALWNQESGWSATATNSSSGAAGIAQNIRGYSSGYQYGNALQQIIWGLAYIKKRYGSIAAAWQHEQQYNWY
jgi:hypothetical protein